MRTRALGFFEDLGSRYDRGFTLNFVTAAQVARSLTEDEVVAALARLQQRHPSLAVDVAGRAATSIPLLIKTTDVEGWASVMTEELRDGHWSEHTAPARCTLLQHRGGGSTLLLTLWHAVSDGKSGILAMRDLLATLASPEQPIEPCAPTRLEDYLPADFRAGAAKRYLARQDELGRVGRFQKWGKGNAAPPKERRLTVAPVRLSPEHTRALDAQAKRHGVTLHGVLSAAIARAICEQAPLPPDAPLLAFHPVDMRSYLARRNEARIPESVGYFISFVDTALRMTSERDLWADAQRYHEGVHGALEAGVPRFTAAGGATLTRLLQRMLGVSLSRRVFEGPFGHAAFALSNLGALERMGVAPGNEHGLGLEALHFAGAGSMTCNICCSAVGLGGGLLLNVGTVHPGLPDDAAARLAVSIEADLLRAAG